MLAKVTRKDPGTGIFQAKIADHGEFHVLLGTNESAKLSVNDTVDIPNPIGKGNQRILNTSTGSSFDAYIHECGRATIGHQWFDDFTDEPNPAS